ncbi:MAG: hypothetical protein D6799_02835 [Bacteroidetes bacterium]|nr:MAG: hypothetical protein D6799_02835 [Bacteroidota bacterium]
MKKLLMIVTAVGFAISTQAMTISPKCGDDKDKKCSKKECCKKGAKEGKECCKKNADKKECANGEKKACCKKDEKKAENTTAQPTTK